MPIVALSKFSFAISQTFLSNKCYQNIFNKLNNVLTLNAEH